MKRILSSMIRLGYGGIVFCVKDDDAALATKLVRDAGRDLIVFSEHGPYRFDFIGAQRGEGGGTSLVDNLTPLLMAVASSRNPMSPDSGRDGDPFFKQNAQRACRCGLDVLVHSGEAVTVYNLLRLISSAPTSAEQLASPEWKAQSFFMRCAQAANAKAKSEREATDLDLSLDFFFLEWVTMGSRTRGSVHATLTGVLDPLSRGLARELLGPGGIQIRPEDCWNGKIIVVDLPVLVYREVGRLIQLVIKTCWQIAAGKRVVTPESRPVFMCIDEAHWLTCDYDWIALTTARSSMTATILATQSVANWLEVYGEHAEARVHSLLGNLSLQIFAQQTCTRTVSYCQQLIGRSRQLMHNGGTDLGGDWLAPLLGDDSGSGNAGFSESMDFELEASDLASLRRGGPPHFEVGTIIYQSGRRFPTTGRTWMPYTFSQQPL